MTHRMDPYLIRRVAVGIAGLVLTPVWAGVDVYPMVFQAGQEGVVHIAGVEPATLADPTLAVEYVRADARFAAGEEAGWNQWQGVPFTLEDGIVSIRHAFPVEEEYTFRLVTRNGEEAPKAAAFAPVYAVDADLFGLRPYKGDFHLHSTASDGNIPAVEILAKCRAKGMDFMAVSDHSFYASSLEAAAKLQGVAQDMRVYPGEEVHPDGNPVHIINFGGSFSVNDFMKKTEIEQTAARIARVREELDRQYAQTLDAASKQQVASSEVAFDLIREGGGIAMFCHPYWRPYHRNYITGEVMDALFDRQKFDVLEVIGGYPLDTLEENALAVARYQQERAKGKVIPVAGVSDAHSYDPESYFWWYNTVVFARSPELADLAESIRANRSLAVENVQGRFPRYYGELRLIKFMYFLNRNFFPLHDQLCREEAVLLERFVAGDAKAADELAARQGRVPGLFDKYYQKP